MFDDSEINWTSLELTGMKNQKHSVKLDHIALTTIPILNNEAMHLNVLDLTAE